MAIANELTIDSNASAMDMAQTIFGDGVQVVSASYTGDPLASGIYSGAQTTIPGVTNSNSGVILSTGNVGTFTNSSGTTNTNTQAGAGSNNAGVDGDADLNTLAGQATFDGAILEASFIPTGDYLTMQFVFSSDEYPEYVLLNVNDSFGVWVNGVFVEATITTSGDIAIDNVNQNANQNLYQDNGADQFNTEMDGLTYVLSFKAPVNVGQVNTIKIAIADGGDAVYDSNVLISADSLQTVALAFDDTVQLGANSTRVVDVLANDQDVNGVGLTITQVMGQPIAIGQTITLGTGEQVTLNPDGTLTITSDGDLGSNLMTYQITDGLGNTDIGYLNIETVANPASDGIVQGTAAGELIDTSYLGDPDGDLVDSSDATGVYGTQGEDDYIVAGAGNDTVMAGDGNDYVAGEEGNDLVFGGLGDDSLSAGVGDDTVYGGLGDDAAYLGAGNDVFGSNGTDSAGNDTAYGGSGQDSLTGGQGDDWLDGGSGNDLLTGGIGSDTLLGGDGADSFDISEDDDYDSIDGGEGGPVDIDTIYFGNLVAPSGVDVLYSGDEDGSYSYFDTAGTGDFTNIESLVLTANADSVDAGASSAGVSVQGLGGDDSLTGGGGDDTLDGGTGDDLITGGSGDDSLSGGDGNDTIDAGPGYGAFPEYADVTGMSQTLTGSNGNVDFDHAVSTDGAAVDTGSAALDGGDTLDGYLVGSATDLDEIHTHSFTQPVAGAILTLAGIDLSETVVIWLDGVAIDLNDALANGLVSFDPGTTGYVIDGAGAISSVPPVVATPFPAELTILQPFTTLSVQNLDADGTGGGSVYTLAVDTNPLSAYGSDDDSVDAGAGDDLVTTGLGDDTVTAGAGNDTVDGGLGNDSLYGDAGDDSLTGFDGDDMLSGGTGNDVLEGGDGNDALTGDAGNDTLTGGMGDDALTGGGDRDVIHADAGDVVDGGEAGDDLDTLIVNDVASIVYGGGNNEAGTIIFNDNSTLTFQNIEVIIADGVTFIAPDGIVHGTAGDDTMESGYVDAQGDIVDGADGLNDTILAGAGNDFIDAGDGDDSVFGEAGNDAIYGGIGNDSLYGGADRDIFYAGAGDVVDGGETGDDLDTLVVDDIQSITYGGGDNESGTITLQGGGTVTFTGIETIVQTGSTPDGLIWGTSGDDSIGAGYIDGNGDITDNNDAILSNAGSDDDEIYGVDGNDTIQSLLGDDDVYGGTGNDHVQTGTGNDYAQGDEGNDTVEGEAGDDFLRGDAGNDSVYGGDGNDSVYGGSGNDSVFGGDGDDHIFGGFGVDTVFGGAGNDIITGSGEDDIVHGDDGDDYMQGSNGADTLYGGLGADTMLGEEDADTFYGGAGDYVDGYETVTTGTDNDTLHVSDVLSVVFDAGNPENGTITFNAGGTLQFFNIENLYVDGVLYGQQDYVVEGTVGDDVIDAAYLGDPEGDRVDASDNLAGTNDDLIEAYGGNDSVLAGDGVDQVFGGSGDDSLYGGGGDDALMGEAGNDLLNGGTGNDLLIGGAGDDEMLGQGGDDSFRIFDAPGSDDIIGGETAETLGDELDASTVTEDSILDLSVGNPGDAEDGRLFIGSDTISFQEIENVLLGSGNDLVIGSSGNDHVSTGDGADTVDGGAGDDSFDLGGADGIEDIAVYGNGDGHDTLSGFDAPIFAAGAYTGVDQLDVSGLLDAGSQPVDTADVVVTDTNGDGTGDAILTFPDGTSVTLAGISPPATGVPAWLEALGIPGVAAVPDYIVEGTGGADIIDAAYLGDPEGDLVDASDNLAGTNDDLIEAYGGNDTVVAGDGNDTVDAGTGDDSVDGGAGNDSLLAGDGNDYLSGDQGVDTLEGAAGEDTLDGGDDNDQLFGGQGDDVLFGGGGADTLGGGDNDDTIHADDGDDYADGDAGNDVIYGGDGSDTVFGGDGDDLIRGGTGNDLLDGDSGNDELIGDDGDDTLFGNDGNDTLSGGQGNDLLIGNGDRDTFNAGIGDTVDGGEGGDDDDTLDLRGYGGAVNVIYDDGNPENGTVEFLDGVGAVVGTMTFSNIENVIVPCFTPGALIATDRGEVKVESLRVGDRVLTRDNGYQDIRWIGRRDLDPAELVAAPQLAPICIRKGSLGLNLPGRDLTVSPQHRMLISGSRPELLFGEHEVLVAAAHMLDRPGVALAPAETGVSYIHILFETHEIIRANGAWSESYQPGELTLAGMEDGPRQEILALFPQLTMGFLFPAARLTLKKHEAKLLFSR